MEFIINGVVIRFYYANFYVMKLKNTCVVIFCFVIMASSHAQDPSFSQFFSSPLNINPSLTARINADWRAISNFRNQWIGPASPYVTSVDKEYTMTGDKSSANSRKQKTNNNPVMLSMFPSYTNNLLRFFTAFLF